jgi:hypothetical protein
MYANNYVPISAQSHLRCHNLAQISATLSFLLRSLRTALYKDCLGVWVARGLEHLTAEASQSQKLAERCIWVDVCVLHNPRLTSSYTTGLSVPNAATPGLYGSKVIVCPVPRAVRAAARCASPRAVQSVEPFSNINKYVFVGPS